jgi:hypothetical protein
MFMILAPEFKYYHQLLINYATKLKTNERPCTSPTVLRVFCFLQDAFLNKLGYFSKIH